MLAGTPWDASSFSYLDESLWARHAVKTIDCSVTAKTRNRWQYASRAVHAKTWQTERIDWKKHVIDWIPNSCQPEEGNLSIPLYNSNRKKGKSFQRKHHSKREPFMKLLRMVIRMTFSRIRLQSSYNSENNENIPVGIPLPTSKQNETKVFSKLWFLGTFFSCG